MQHNFRHSQYHAYILGFIILLVVVEMFWSWHNDKKAYNLKDTLTNIAVLLGFNLSKLLFAGYQLAILGFAARIAVFHFNYSLTTFLLTFFLADFIYYWFHRISHIWKPLWAFHLIHHSGTAMNLTYAYRLNWFSALVSPVFFVPLAVLGLPPDFIVLSYALNLLYQFLLHTEAIRTLGKAEGIIDTPSAHRVHHGCNEIYIDKNFGGVLMIWDRLFKTYEPETEKVQYGLSNGFTSNNPFKLVIQGFIDLFKR